MSVTVRVEVLETQRVLVIARGGRLQPWLGPALRGLAGGRLKAEVCRHPVQLQLSQWRYCRGCPLRSGCAYGETIEGGHTEKADPARPIVIAPVYPCPEYGQVGDRLLVQVRFIGPVAAAHAGAFWEALRRGGADPGLGLGEDRVLFDVVPGPEADRHQVYELPVPDASAPWLPAVRVELTSPLILQPRINGQRHLMVQPRFADLLRAWGHLAELLEPAAGAVARRWLGRVLELAERVPLQEGQLERVGQKRMSHRSGERWQETGVIGWMRFGPVACGLLPWLEAAGRLHIGTHRSVGAGGWRVVVETRLPAAYRRRVRRCRPRSARQQPSVNSSV